MMHWILTATTVALVGASACSSTGASAVSSPLTASPDGESTHALPVYAWPEVDSAVKSGAVLVDARGADSYAQGHIAGAINVPAGDEAAYATLPADKATALIFYCGGPACSASTKGAVKAQTLGYQKVGEYKGGYPEWSKAQITQ